MSDLPVQTYTNATNNRVLTSAGADSINGEANLTFDGSTLTVTGDANVAGDLSINEKIIHNGNTNTYMSFPNDNRIKFTANGTDALTIYGNTTPKKIESDTYDFSVLGTSDASIIFADFSTDKMGVMTSVPTHTLSVSGTLSVSSSVNLPGIQAGTATTSSYLALDSSNNMVLTSSSGGGGGAVTSVANGSNNRIATFAAAATLNGEANLTFDGSVLNISGGVVHKRRAVASNYTASSSDFIIGVSASAVLDILMPKASDLSSGQTFTIKDEGGNANSYNITVNMSGSDSVDGASSIVLESPFAAVNLYTDGSSKFFIY